MNTTPGHVFELLALHPYPGAKDVALDGSVLTFTVNGVKVCLDDDGWYVGDLTIIPHFFFDKPTLHAEVDRVLRLHAEMPLPRAIKADAAKPAPDAAERLQDRMTDECDRRRDLEDALERIGETVGVESGLAEHDTERIAFIERRVEATRERCDALQQLLPLLGLGVNSPADKARERIEGLGAEIDRLKAKVKRLLRQRRAAHDVLDEAGIGLEPEGSPRWTLARRCRAAVAPVWGYLDAMWTLDEIAKLCGLTAPSVAGGATHDEVIVEVKTLAADAGFYRLDRPAYLEANQARERIAAHLRLPGSAWAQLADAIVAPKTSRLRRALARLAR